VIYLLRAWQDGECIRTIDQFGQPVSSCAWAPDGESFVTGALDKVKNLCQWGLDGRLIYDWERSHRIADVAISPDGQRLVAMDHTSYLHIYNFVTRDLEYSFDLKVRGSSLSFSKNSAEVIVNNIAGETLLFDIESQMIVRQYEGQKGGKFVIRTVFGGASESFIISGSEGRI
jgi:WD40 repeat protein